MAVEPGFEKFFGFYNKIRFFSLILWIAVIGAGGYFGIKFLGMTNLKYDPPIGSQGLRDLDLYRKFFTKRASEGQLVILLGSVDGQNGTDVHKICPGASSPWANESSQMVINAINNSAEYKDFVTQLVGRYTWTEEQIEGDWILSMYVDQAFFGPKNYSTIMLMSIAETGTDKAMNFVTYLRKELEKIDTCNGTFAAHAIGIDSITQDMSLSAVDDMKNMDVFAMPIALLVLVYVVQSLTVMIIPIIAVIASAALSFGLMYVVCLFYDVPTFCPAMMMSVIVAMSIDYSLFILTRFHEEIMNGHTNYNAVMNTLRHSGQTIATSGLILSICMLSMLFFPVLTVRIVGVSCVISLISTQLAALWLSPSLLLIGIKMFSIPGVIPCIKSCRVIEKKTRFQLHQEETKGVWFRFTYFTTTKLHAVLLILAIVIFLAPFCAGLYYLYTVTGLGQAFPRGSETSAAYDRFSQEWAVGMLEPFDVVAVPTSLVPPDFHGNKTDPFIHNYNDLKNSESSWLSSSSLLPWLSSSSSSSSSSHQPSPVPSPTPSSISSSSELPTIFCDEYFEVAHDLIQALVDTGGIDDQSLLSITDLSGIPLDVDTAQGLLDDNELAYTYVFDYLTNEDRTSTRITISTTFDPNLDSANVTHMIRPILEEFTNKSNYTFVLVGGLVAQGDSAEEALDYLPYILIATMIIIGIAVAIVYRAFLLPLRMVITIALTVVWTYGVLSVIFCSGWFNFIKPIAKQPGLNWVVPNLSIFMCIGLALDYDIFLFTRVREFRLRGWSNRASIVKGVSRTGRVITFAGVIMAIAFGGLASSSLLTLDQFAWALMLSVLLDTFVIRTTLNPAIMYLCGRLNYGLCIDPPKYDDPCEFHPEAEDKTEAFDNDDEEASIATNDEQAINSSANETTALLK